MLLLLLARLALALTALATHASAMCIDCVCTDVAEYPVCARCTEETMGDCYRVAEDYVGDLSVAAVSPTAHCIIVDVNVSGTTVFTTPGNRPTIAVSTFVAAQATIEDAAHTNGQYLTVDVDQIGSTLPGENLVVAIRYRRT